MDPSPDIVRTLDQRVRHAAADNLHAISRYSGSPRTHDLLRVIVIVQKICIQLLIVLFPDCHNLIRQDQMSGNRIVEAISGSDIGFFAVIAEDIGIDRLKHIIVGLGSGQGLLCPDIRSLLTMIALKYIGIFDNEMLLVGLAVGKFGIIAASGSKKTANRYLPERKGQDQEEGDQPDAVSFADHRLR